MPVKVRCGECEEVLSLPDRARGKKVRCPHCESPVKVPAGKAGAAAPRKKASAAAGDTSGDDFLADLDLNRLEDRRSRVCPKCGADVPEDEFECPKCFVDIRTGKITEKRRKKLDRKGPDPADYYKTAWSDGWRYLQRNHKLALRTFLYLTLFVVPGFGLLLLAVYFHRLPLKVFFSFLTLTSVLAAPGWLWFLWLEVLQGTLDKKPKLKRVGFDYFLNVSLGLKAIAWVLIFALPILLIPAGIGILLITNDNAVVGGIVIGLGCLPLLPLVPIGLAHMVMPVTWPGWVSPYCAKTFLKVPGPALYWLLFSSVALLPFIVSATVGGFVARRDTEDVINTVRLNATIYKAQEEIKEAADARAKASGHGTEVEPLNVPSVDKLYELAFDPAVQRLMQPEWIPQIQAAKASLAVGGVPSLNEITGVKFPFQKLILPGVFLVLICATIAAGIPFCMRMNGLFVHYFKRDLDLITMAREAKYVASDQKVDATGEPIKKSEVNVGKIVASVGGTILFYAIANVVVYFASGGEYVLLPRPIARMLNLIQEKSGDSSDARPADDSPAKVIAWQAPPSPPVSAALTGWECREDRTLRPVWHGCYDLRAPPFRATPETLWTANWNGPSATSRPSSA